MRHLGILTIISAFTQLCAQDGQKDSRPGWPCVSGRVVDPSYLDVSESTGGQLFFFQKNEVAHASLVMSSSYTHPATVLRVVGNFSGSRDFEFPVDSSIESILVLASLQCRNAILVSRPNGSELTAANSAQSVDLQAGRILRVDLPEPGQWRVRLTGTGLYVLSVVAKTHTLLSVVNFFAIGDPADAGHESRLSSPLSGVLQHLGVHISGQVSKMNFQMVDATGASIAQLDTAEPISEGTYRINITPSIERFRILVTGIDSMGWPFQRTHPVLFRAERSR